jgi:hypothetical protein
VVFVFNFFVIFISFQKSHLVFKSYKLIKKSEKKRETTAPPQPFTARASFQHTAAAHLHRWREVVLLHLILVVFDAPPELECETLSNSALSFLIRECSGVQPQLWLGAWVDNNCWAQTLPPPAPVSPTSDILAQAGARSSGIDNFNKSESPTQ